MFCKNALLLLLSATIIGSTTVSYDQKLFDAVKKGYLKPVNEIITKEPYKVNEKISGMPLLTIAVFGGRTAVAKYLIRHGAKVNEKSITGGTALQTAACNGNLELVKFLVEAGAEIHSKELIMADRMRRYEILAFLISNGVSLVLDDTDIIITPILQFAVEFEMLKADKQPLNEEVLKEILEHSAAWLPFLIRPSLTEFFISQLIQQKKIDVLKSLVTAFFENTNAEDFSKKNIVRSAQVIKRLLTHSDYLWVWAEGKTIAPQFYQEFEQRETSEKIMALLKKNRLHDVYFE